MPDRLPDGDPVDYALPVFLEEPPRAAFTAKDRDVVLSCSAAHAHDIYWECNDRNVSEVNLHYLTLKTNYLNLTIMVL